MKTTLNSWIIAGIIALFAVSCSQTDDYPVDDALKAKEKAALANSPLVATPTELYFNNVITGTSVEDTVNVKTSGLSLITGVTNFDVEIQGEDASQFSVEDDGMSLGELLTALLGGGKDIPVTYFPTSEGTHEAELLITATLLGLLNPVQIIVPLHGTAVLPPAPQLVSTVPANGGSTTFDGRVPNVEGTPLGQYHLDFVFDVNVYIGPNFNAYFPQVVGASIQKVELINSKTLRFTLWEGEVSASVVRTLIIDENSIIREGQTSNNQSYQLTYKVTGSIPNNYVNL